MVWISRGKVLGLLAVLVSLASAAVFQERRVGQVADGLDIPELVPEQEINAPGYDVTVVVSDSSRNLEGDSDPIVAIIRKYQAADRSFGANSLVLVDDRTAVPSGCLVYQTIADADRDIVDDVRRYEDAVTIALNRARSAGKRRPLLVIPRSQRGSVYDTDLFVSLMAALQVAYRPLAARREHGPRYQKFEKIGVWGAGAQTLRHTIRLASALEKGRIVMRDICAGDPEEMAPPKVEAYVRKVFNTTTTIDLDVISDTATLEKEYPILAAVNRAASTVERHRGRVIFLEYKGTGTVNQTLFLLGKGITFDTGGANIKTGTRMPSMSRDKCGAAVVAGFMKILTILKPPHLRVVGAMPMVRNSVGEEAYVPDEVITARSGQKVMVGNTDAEGRMIMADTLCHMKEMALKSVNPHLLTLATLTGHAIRTVGKTYAIVLDNGPARAKRSAESLMETGDLFADPLEMSRLRREDFGAHSGRSQYANLNNIYPSNNRGHQTPMAFLMQVSGLHPRHSSGRFKEPLAYTHLDIAGPSMTYPSVPQGSPLVALTAQYVFSPKDKADLARGSWEDVKKEEKKKEEEEKKKREESKKKEMRNRFYDFYF